MDKRADHKHFFLYHLYDEVQQKYGLTDQEMDKLLEFIKKFHGRDAGKALKQIRKRKNKNSLDQIVQEITGKELDMKSQKEMKFDPVSSRSPLTFPTGLPLSQDMIIQPHYNGEYGTGIL